MDPIPSSNGSLDIALFNMHNQSPRQRNFQTVDATELASRQEINTELLMFALISRLTRCRLENPLAGAHYTCSCTSLYREDYQQKYRNTVSECRFSPLSASVPLLRNDRGLDATASIQGQNNQRSASPISRSILSSNRCYKGVKIIKFLSFSNQIPFYFYLGRSYSNGRYSFCGKGPLAIAAMNAELPPSKLGT